MTPIQVPVIQLLCHPGSLPNFHDKAILAQPPPGSLQHVPFFIYLRLDLFHLSGPQNVAAPISGVSSAWFTTHAKKSVGEKLKGLKQLLVPHISPQPELEENEDIQIDNEENAQELRDSLVVETEPEEPDVEDFTNGQPSPAASSTSTKTVGAIQLSSSEDDDDSDSSSASAEKRRRAASKKADKEKDKVKPKPKTVQGMIPLSQRFQDSSAVWRGSSSQGSAKGSSSSSSPPTGNKTISRLQIEDENTTPKNKKRKKGEHKEEPGASNEMAILVDELIPQSTLDRREWRLAHSVGKQSIGPEEIQDPHTRWRNRPFNADHVRELRESFQLHQKMNCKGLKLVLISTELWQKFAAMDDDERAAARTKGSDFYKQLRAQRQFAPFTGDHTRRAASELKATYPSNPKWGEFKKAKIYLAPNDTDTDNMLRLLGNANNTAAALHLKLAFSDKVQQLHEYYVANDLLTSETGRARRAPTDGLQTLFLKETAESWGMPPASMGQVSGLAKLSGRAWDNLYLILSGQYKVPGAKTVGGPPPNAISHFNNMGDMPLDVKASLFGEIVAGNLALKKLPERCIRWKAMNQLQLYILATVAAARPSRDIKTWSEVIGIVPSLCTDKFLNSWVSSIKVKHDKICDPPPALKEAILAQCMEVRQQVPGAVVVGGVILSHIVLKLAGAEPANFKTILSQVYDPEIKDSVKLGFVDASSGNLSEAHFVRADHVVTIGKIKQRPYGATQTTTHPHTLCSRPVHGPQVWSQGGALGSSTALHGGVVEDPARVQVRHQFARPHCPPLG
jgi:hypothetical protein